MPKNRKRTIASPKTDNPVKEMQWCFKKHIYVTWEPEAILQGGYYKQTGKYRINIRNGQQLNHSEYIYTGQDIIDAVHDTYREIYKRNYGKRKK